MVLTDEQLMQLKSIELELLKAFIGVCEKLSLKYYLLGGTLLGAIRHKGFIPWDDDIDVGMLRADYERFLSEGQALLPEYYFVQCKKTDHEYPMNFAKLRDSRTTFIETSVQNYHMNHGVFIDVFPLDFYPDAALSRKVFDIRQQLMKFRMRTAVTIPAQARHDRKTEVMLKIAERAACMVYPDFDIMQEKKEKMYTQAKSGAMIGNFCGAWGKREIMPAEWYGEGAVVEFEGIQARAPGEYSNWLTHVYGDYMQLPPVEKRVSHHYAKAIDFEKPYTIYCGGKEDMK